MYNSCLALFGPTSHQTYPGSNYLSVIVAILSSSYIGFILGRHLSTTLLPPSSASSLTRKVFCFNEKVGMFLFPGLIIFNVLLLTLLAALLPHHPAAVLHPLQLDAARRHRRQGAAP